ncbi:MAG: beta-lactamase family protein [Deltaproteobacteria bacterium]|nr:beta-lactamase family protein [Deltaproteobacteria bacterium]MBW2420206.1 beta-lactamase family protein [Deltaproteobacteria bacterium]
MKLPTCTLSAFRSARCDVPEDLESVTTIGEETAPGVVGSTRDDVEAIWQDVERFYAAGGHPAIQICIRKDGEAVLHRAIGHASGNAPGDTPDTPKVPCTLDTPINIFSASKAITAMVIHKLDEKGALHLDDAITEYIPEFGRHGKHRIQIRHVLAHRAGMPNLPPEALDLELLAHPDRVLELLCDAELQSRPGRALAYHAVTGGFVLAELVQRVTGKGIQEVLREEITGPLGLERLRYGVVPEDIDQVAINAFTGPPVPPPISTVLKRALGAGVEEVVELSNDPRFLTGVIPSANVITTAHDLSVFYQCLLDHGRYGDVQVFEPRTVRHATAEQSYWEIDFTLGVPLRYGMGFMLGNKKFGPFGTDNPHAFGHIGFSNVFSWADPDRGLVVSLLNTGKPVLSRQVLPLLSLLGSIGRAFPNERGHRNWLSAATG